MLAGIHLASVDLARQSYTVAETFYTLTICMRVPGTPQTLGIVCLFNFSHSGGCATCIFQKWKLLVPGTWILTEGYGHVSLS